MKSGDIKDRLEPEVGYGMYTGAEIVSIAISLKRIADVLAGGDGAGVSIQESLYNLVQKGDY